MPFSQSQRLVAAFSKPCRSSCPYRDRKRLVRQNIALPAMPSPAELSRSGAKLCLRCALHTKHRRCAARPCFAVAFLRYAVANLRYAAAARGLALPSLCLSVPSLCASEPLPSTAKPLPRAQRVACPSSALAKHVHAMPLLRQALKAAAAHRNARLRFAAALRPLPRTAVAAQTLLCRGSAVNRRAKPLRRRAKLITAHHRDAKPPRCFAVPSRRSEVLCSASAWLGAAVPLRCEAVLGCAVASHCMAVPLRHIAWPSQAVAALCGEEPCSAVAMPCPPVQSRCASVPPPRSSTFSGSRAIRTCRDRCSATARFP